MVAFFWVLFKELAKVILAAASIGLFLVCVVATLIFISRPAPCKPGFVMVNGYCVTGYKPD